VSLSNSEQQSLAILEEYAKANRDKNAASRIEAKALKELKEFANEGGKASFVLEGVNYNFAYGEQEVLAEIIDPGMLLSYVVDNNLDMAQFLSCVTVVKERANKIFSEAQLAKLTKQTVNKVWKIKKEK
jgi:hypothetical protein